MPIVNGNYEERSADEIREELEDELQNEFGEDIDLTESSVFTTFSNVLANVLATNQELSIGDVYDAAFLDSATGVDLDRVVSIIGIQRRPSIHATGVQRFQAPSKVRQDYVIQSGTTVQTRSGTPVRFETTESALLGLIASFEDDLSDFSGDVNEATILPDADATDGDNVLELAATDGARIYLDDIELQQGSVYHCDVRPQTGTVPSVLFAIDPERPNDYYQIAFDESVDEVRLEFVEEGNVLEVLDTTTAVGLTADEFHEAQIDWRVTNDITITVRDVDDNDLTTLAATDERITSGYAGFKSGDANGVKQFDWFTTSEISANIRALVGGVSGNVGANTIRRMPSPVAGVDTTTNLYETGNNNFKDRNQENFVTGQNEETDDQLRERAEDAVTEGGAATHDAIVSELVNNTTGVSSVTIYENKTDIDNVGSGGLPPHSFEAVVFGGDSTDVAQSIFDTKAVTSRDYGGVRGAEVTETVTSQANGQTRTISFSRPTDVSISMSLDLIINENYVGDTDIRDQIVQYIGGTQSNDSTVVGLGVGDDVRIDQLQDIVVGDENGVIGLDQSVDGNPIETTPTATTVNGLNVIEIGANEVATANATDATITVNTREQ